MGLFCIMFEIKRDIGRKSRFFHTHLAFGVPKRWNIAVPFAVEKLEWCGYAMVKKGDYKADTIAACDGRTDKQTDRQTSFCSTVRTMHTRLQAVKIASLFSCLLSIWYSGRVRDDRLIVSRSASGWSS